jgi:hypothetical protein
MFQTEVVERNETYMLCSVHFLRKRYGFRDNETKANEMGAMPTLPGLYLISESKEANVGLC